MNIDIKKAAIGAALVFAGWKGYGQKAVVNTALIAVGSVMLAKQAPVVGAMV